MVEGTKRCIVHFFCIDYFGQYMKDIDSFQNTNKLFGDEEFLAKFSIVKGSFCLSDVTLFSEDKRFRFQENSSFTIFLLSDDILSPTVTNFSIDRLSSQQNFTIKISFSHCSIGEYLDSQDMLCKPCQTNFFSFSLNIIKPSSCINCESFNFFCYGGNQLSPKQGYWRLNEQSINFLRCPTRQGKIGCINAYAGYSQVELSFCRAP